MEIQQSPMYARYMQRLKWTVVRVNGTFIYIRKFLFTGGIAKIHRPKTLPKLQYLLPIFQKYSIRTVVLEPDLSQNTDQLRDWTSSIGEHIKLYKGTPFLPTKTIRVQLSHDEQHLFKQFSEAKRRAVRRAIKNNINCFESTDIASFIHLKQQAAGLFGFITTTGLKELWQTFAPNQATIILASSAQQPQTPIAGLLILYCDHIAYYWIAAATNKGKHAFAPTLLVWEAIKTAKRHNARIFDFVGAWDERTPRRNREWLGFTKFKEGFGGKSYYYPLTSNHNT